MGLRPRLHAEAAEATWPGRGLQPAGSASAPLRISLRLTARLLRLPLKGGVILERLVQAAMCKPNMVYTVPPNVGCPRRGCPVIPGLGAHKGRPYGYVQNDNSDQATRSPLEGESPLGARASRPHAVAYGGR